ARISRSGGRPLLASPEARLHSSPGRPKEGSEAPPADPESLEVVPLTSVRRLPAEDSELPQRGGKLFEVAAIGADEGSGRPHGRHPHVVEDDLPTDRAEPAAQREVNEHAIEAVVAVDEDEIELLSLSSQIGGRPRAVILGDAAGSLHSHLLDFFDSYSVPQLVLIRVHGRVVTRSVFGERRQDEESAEPVRQPDVERRGRFRLETRLVEP